MYSFKRTVAKCLQYCSCAENAVAVAADVNEVIRVLLLRAFAAFAVDVVAVGISGCTYAVGDIARGTLVWIIILMQWGILLGVLWCGL